MILIVAFENHYMYKKLTMNGELEFMANSWWDFIISNAKNISSVIFSYIDQS